jgi:hypothetical protein
VEHFRPRGKSVRAESPSWEDEVLAVHELFECSPSYPERFGAIVLLAQVQKVEHHVEGRSRQVAVVDVPEPFEPAHELLVEDGHLPVERETLGLELGERGNDLPEAFGVVSARAADEPHAASVLERQHPPAVHLLLVNPTLVVDRTGDQGGMHQQSGERGLTSSLGPID